MRNPDNLDKGKSATGSPPAFHYLFDEQAGKTPDSEALVDSGSVLTYRELARKTDLLAAKLRESGVGRDVPVGIYMERCSEYVVAMISAMKAGGAFLPVELAYPPSMVGEVIRDSETPVVLTKSRFLSDLPQGPEVIALDDETFALESEISSEEIPVAQPDDLAFISYSSGTTGKPKGIANPHRAMVGSYLWRFGLCAPEPGDRVACNVFFIWEALRPLLRGATTVVIPDDVIFDPKALVDFLARYEVTESLFTPSLLESVLNHSGEPASRLPHLETLWLNGEVVTKPLAGRASEALPKTKLMNVYSISETHEVAAGDLRELAKNEYSAYCPVGEPMDSDDARILGEEMQPVRDGEAGELYVAGDWLAREYVGMPEKTAERFLTEPSGERVYRTGDRARLLPGGELEILGRCDFMVKVRGYSVELGAVESAIQESLPVRGCCAVADGEEGTDKRLVAYLVPNESGELFDVDSSGRSAGLRRALKTALPHYAIPSAFVVTDSLPLQETTGKVDRTELPPPPKRTERISPAPPDRLHEESSARETQDALCRAFERVLNLGVGEVERDEDFFEIGGHSLAAAELLTVVEDVSGVRLSMEELLHEATPEGISGRLVSRLEGAYSSAHDSPSPLDDVVLDEDVFPAGTVSSVTLADAKRILLTGATGYLGAFLLDGILRHTDARVYCLARPKNGTSPKAAIRSNLASYDLWRPEYDARIEAVSGDLSKPSLGLDGETFARLADEIETVIHAGATVNLLYPYASLRDVNVEGTREIIRLCCEGRTKPLHYVSTNGIFPESHGSCLEDEDVSPLIHNLEDGYGQSKWTAEMLVRAASERGLPTVVYRPGNISGDSGSGRSNERDSITSVLKASLETGTAPDIAGHFEMTPVDFVAKAILEISSREDSFGGTFHLANPNPPDTATVYDLLESEGYPLERLEPSEWRDGLPDGGRYAIARATFEGDSSHVFSDGNGYDDRNTRDALEVEGTGISRPEITGALLARYALRLTDIEPQEVHAGGRRAS